MIDPCPITQPSNDPNRPRSQAAARTHSASWSNEYTLAPSRCAASEKRPLPQPTSRKERPVMSGYGSASAKDAVAAAMRCSLTSFV